MPTPTGSDDVTSHHQEHEQRSEVMLTTPPTTSLQLRHPAYNNASTGAAISSENGTLVVDLKSDVFSYNRTGRATNESNNNNVNNTTTISYEQLSREFYKTYDPSIGLHTAAVLGGILVWLVLYVVYRTKVRKCVLRFIKKQFREESDLDPKLSDTDWNCGASTNMVRTLINPSIVIDASPPLSPLTCDNYSRPGEEECFSPFSIHGPGINEDGVYCFPYSGHGGSQQYLNNHQTNSCLAQHEMLHQLPKSEMDIPTATAHWVQNMPLETRSHQDFTNLMFSLQSRGLLAMQKPCSCPLLCPRSPQPLLMLEMPSSWNKSMPALSTSLSSQMLSAYETVPMKHNSDKDIKDIINAKRKTNTHKYESENREQVLCEKNFLEKFNSNRRNNQAGTAFRGGHDKRKSNLKMPPRLAIKTIDCTENQPLLENSNLTRSPIPIPFTPTVMIQTVNPTQRRRQDCDSNASFSSNSSADMLLAAIRAPPIHITKPGSPPNIYSPRHVSPSLENRNQNDNQNIFSWSHEDIKRYHEEKCISECANPPAGCVGNHACPFKCQRRQIPADKDCYAQRHHVSCDDSNSTNEARHRGLFSPRRSLSDYNCYDDFLLNISPTSREHYQRSLSADVPILGKIISEVDGPVCSKESNTNSSMASCYPTSPYLLQVPDPNNVHISMTPDFGGSNKSHLGTSCTSPQPFLRHGVHSDSNIAYFTGQFVPSDSNVENYSVRPHSAFIPGEINLSFFEDNTVRPSSSFGSSGSCNSPHHHPHLPHRHSSHHHPLHHDQHQNHHHHSTGMLGLEDSNGQHNIGCISNQHPFMNRSFSAVVMETKL